MYTLGQHYIVINSFLQNSSELDEKSKLQDQIFSYMLQKHILYHQPNLSLTNAILSEVF